MTPIFEATLLPRIRTSLVSRRDAPAPGRNTGGSPAETCLSLPRSGPPWMRASPGLDDHLQSFDEVQGTDRSRDRFPALSIPPRVPLAAALVPGAGNRTRMQRTDAEVGRAQSGTKTRTLLDPKERGCQGYEEARPLPAVNVASMGRPRNRRGQTFRVHLPQR